MSRWPSTKARRVLAALLRIGWSIKREVKGSHRVLTRPGVGGLHVCLPRSGRDWSTDACTDLETHRTHGRRPVRPRGAGSVLCFRVLRESRVSGPVIQQWDPADPNGPPSPSPSLTKAARKALPSSHSGERVKETVESSLRSIGTHCFCVRSSRWSRQGQRLRWRR